jgi:hypothetical protein
MGAMRVDVNWEVQYMSKNSFTHKVAQPTPLESVFSCLKGQVYLTILKFLNYDMAFE